MLCHVAICTPPFTTLTYATPEGFPGFDWKPGLRVAVPLGNGAIRVGVVTAIFPDGDERAFAGASAGQHRCYRSSHAHSELTRQLPVGYTAYSVRSEQSSHYISPFCRLLGGSYYRS